MHNTLQKTVYDFFRGDLHKQNEDIGLELEIEGTHLPGEIAGWMLKSEGSLRNGGIEYVTNGSVSLSGLRHRLVRLNRTFQEAGTVVKPSIRTSTHIHINMQQQPLRTVLGFILLFTAIEPILLRLCGPDRNGNVFCLSSYDTGDMGAFSENLARYIKAGGSQWYARGKYAALNTDSLRTFGTLEVRCLPLSTDTDKILEWVTWLLNIRRIAHTWPDETYRTLIETLRDNPIPLVHDIFHTIPELRPVTAPYNPLDYIRAGVETAYEVYRPLRGLLTADPNEKTTERSGNYKMRKTSMFVPAMTIPAIEEMAVNPWQENEE